MHSSLSTELWICPEFPVSPARVEALCRSLLDENERRRLARLRRAGDRQRYVLARTLTRRALGERLGVNPAALRFSVNEYGKPMLAPAHASTLRFNLSHTPGMLALALSERGEVGVDVEAVAREVELLALARRYFSAFENASLEALGDEQRRERFFRYWTLKEAWVKAKGLGLRLPLDAFWFEPAGAESGDGDEHEVLLRCGPGLRETPEHWRFRCYTHGGHRLALAQHLAPDEVFGVSLRELGPGWLDDPAAFR